MKYYKTKEEADIKRKIHQRVYYDTKLKMFYIRNFKTPLTIFCNKVDTMNELESQVKTFLVRYSQCNLTEDELNFYIDLYKEAQFNLLTEFEYFEPEYTYSYREFIKNKFEELK